MFLIVGTTRIGLTEICVQFEGQTPEEERCEDLKMSSYWAVTLIFIVIGICLITATVALLLISKCRSNSEKMARIIGFLASMFHILYLYILYISSLYDSFNYFYFFIFNLFNVGEA